MFKKLFPLASLLSLLLFFPEPALTADYVFLLPKGLKIGEINGPGNERLSRALKKRLSKGPNSYVLSGVVHFEQSSQKERELTPLEKPAGAPYEDYVPDLFTHRLWRQKVSPVATSLDSFDLERYIGLMILDWTITSADSGEALNRGRVIMDINRTRGGYLATEGLAPRMSSQKSDREFEDRLVDDLVRLLALDLGRSVSVSELENGSDKWSRGAKSLASAGNWDGARNEWEKILEMNPKYGPALYNLGVYWEHSGNPEEALRYYRAAFVSDASVRHRRTLTRLTETLRRAERLPDSAFQGE